VQLTVAVRNARLSALATALGAGGTQKSYTGTSPGASVAPTGTLLCTLTAVVCAAPSGGTMAISATSDPSAAASGTPGYTRLATSGGTAVADFTSGVGSGELSFDRTVAAALPVADTSFVLSEGNA
jgi:hypothetical protein